MKTSSAKAKGRRLQQGVRDVLREIAKPYGLEEGDIESIGMGQNGCDIILSPAAKRVLLGGLAIECKNVEALRVLPTFLEHYAKYQKDDRLKLLIHSRNAKKVLDQEALPLVTLRLCDFSIFLEVLVAQHMRETERKIGFTKNKK